METWGRQLAMFEGGELLNDKLDDMVEKLNAIPVEKGGMLPMIVHWGLCPNLVEPIILRMVVREAQ